MEEVEVDETHDYIPMTQEERGDFLVKGLHPYHSYYGGCVPVDRDYETSEEQRTDVWGNERHRMVKCRDGVFRERYFAELEFGYEG